MPFQSWVFLRLLVVVFVLHTVSCRSDKSSGAPFARQPWGIHRAGGGDVAARESLFCSVGIVSVGNAPTDIPPSDPSGLVKIEKTSRIILYGENQKPCQSIDAPNDAAEALGVVCDVIVLIVRDQHSPKLSQSDSEMRDLVMKIQEGAKRRAKAGYTKSSVLVVLDSKKIKNGEEVIEDVWMNQIIHGDLKDLDPSIFRSLDLADTNDATAILRQVVTETEGSMIGNFDQWTELFRQVHESLTGTQRFEPLVETLEDQSGLVDFIDYKSTDDHAAELPAAIPVQAETIEDEYALAQKVLSDAQEKMDKLRLQQEEVWLDSDSKVPLLQFGSESNSILEEASRSLKRASNATREHALNKITSELKELYDNQLQSLREHHGRQYEDALDKGMEEAELTQVAAKITEKFRTAAQHAVPALCQEGEEFSNADFSYVSTLHGLLTDMMEAMSLRMEAQDLEEEDEDAERPTPWYKKLAARAIVLGINYLQGWLAWQGIKRAAIQRDKDMPKFPLF